MSTPTKTEFCTCAEPSFPNLREGDPEVPDIYSDHCAICGKELSPEEKANFESANGIAFESTLSEH